VARKKSIVMSQQSMVNSIVLLTACCLLLTVYCGCASLSERETILAIVDGTPITEDDLTYALTIAHRREDLSSAGTLDIRQYVDKLADERLIMNEARSAGIDQYPEVRQAIDAYILRESVIKLHSEEIVTKVTITEQEFEEFYKTNYMRYILGVIEAESEEKAHGIYGELNQGNDFIESAKKYSKHPSQEKGGELTLTALSLALGLRDTVSGLKPGEISTPVKVGEKYYIIRLVRKEDAPAEECEKARKKVEKALREQKEKTRSDEFLAYLRGKANVTINHELLAGVNLNGSEEERKKRLEDRTPLVTMNDTVLTVSDFLSSIPPKNRKSKEQLIESWIERKLVDKEALGRHYENNPEMKKRIHRYENHLLKDTFVKKIIFPRVVITEQTLKDYYAKHKDAFTKPVCYKIQQITVKTREEAEEMKKSLSAGADFGWMVKKKSVDPHTSRGGDSECLTKKEFPEPLRDILEMLNPGEISPVVELDQMYRIFMIRGQEGETVEEFEKVREAVYRASVAEQVDAFMEKYVSQLRIGAQIHIYSDEISTLEKKLKI
jgi:parvulin-like peptidyl-prolyl isomerase